MVKTYDKARTGRDGGAAEHYSARHLRFNEYLNENERIQGVWIGHGCADVGVKERGIVQDKEFHDVALNRHAETGEEITREVPNRKPFCDLVVTLPKTFSVQCVLGQDDRCWNGTRLTWRRC
jgi:hypothetical protein